MLNISLQGVSQQVFEAEPEISPRSRLPSQGTSASEEDKELQSDMEQSMPAAEKPPPDPAGSEKEVEGVREQRK